MQVHFVVGQHETHAFMLRQRLAESLAPTCIVGGSFVCAAGSAQPAHAMRQPRRCQPNLRVLQALTGFTQHIGHRHPQAFKPHHSVPTGEAGVHRVHLPLDANARLVHVGQEHGGARARRVARDFGHDDGKARSHGAGDQPLHAINHISVAIELRCGLQHGRVRARTRRGLGHAKAGAHMPLHQRQQPALLLFSRGDQLHQVNVAFVGGMNVHGHRAQWGITGFFKHDGLVHMRQPQTAMANAGVRREQTSLPGMAHQFLTQVFARAVRRLARVMFIRHHHIFDEPLGTLLQAALFGGKAEIHDGGFLGNANCANTQTRASV